MKFNTLKSIMLFFIVFISLSGCGGGSDSPQNTPSNNKNITHVISVKNKFTNQIQRLFNTIKNSSNTALIMDATSINGLRINCNSHDIITDKEGMFKCNNLPFDVYLGDFKIGTLNKINIDKVIYTQDILNLSRADMLNPNVTKLSMIFQSLDEDANLKNGIKITPQSISILSNELANFTDVQHLTFDDVENIIDNVIDERKADNVNVKLRKVSKKDAQINLIKAFINSPAESL